MFLDPEDMKAVEMNSEDMQPKGSVFLTQLNNSGTWSFLATKLT
jgi:hypothetical protein